MNRETTIEKSARISIGLLLIIIAFAVLVSCFANAERSLTKYDLPAHPQEDTSCVLGMGPDGIEYDYDCAFKHLPLTPFHPEVLTEFDYKKCILPNGQTDEDGPLGRPDHCIDSTVENNALANIDGCDFDSCKPIIYPRKNHPKYLTENRRGYFIGTNRKRRGTWPYPDAWKGSQPVYFEEKPNPEPPNYWLCFGDGGCVFILPIGDMTPLFTVTDKPVSTFPDDASKCVVDPTNASNTVEGGYVAAPLPGLSGNECLTIDVKGNLTAGVACRLQEQRKKESEK